MKIPTVSQMINENAQYEILANKVQKLLDKHFKGNAARAVFSSNLSESIYIQIILGQKKDWSGGISHNSPMRVDAFVWLHSNGEMKMDWSNGVSILQNPPEGSYLAYGRAKMRMRGFTTKDEKVLLKKLDTTFKKMKEFVKANLSNLPTDMKYIEKYL